eukprot:1195725-Prorocentrum_minimum.AAC.2
MNCVRGCVTQPSQRHQPHQPHQKDGNIIYHAPVPSQANLRLASETSLSASETSLSAPETDLCFQETSLSASETSLSAPETDLSTCDEILAAPESEYSGRIFKLQPPSAPLHRQAIPPGDQNPALRSPPPAPRLEPATRIYCANARNYPYQLRQRPGRLKA